MAEGALDYTQKVLMIETENLFGKPIYVGDSELAARLGSPVTFERRGNVYLVDSFEEGLNKCVPTTSGTGAQVYLDTERARTGGYSCKLVAGSDEDRYAGVRWRVALISREGLMGVEWHWCAGGYFRAIEARVRLRTTGLTSRFGVRLFQPGGEIYVWGPSDTWEETGLRFMFNPAEALFHAAKLVLDLLDGKYKRLQFNSIEYDLSEWEGYRPEFGNLLYVEFEIRLETFEGFNGWMWLDDVILTINEPED